MKLSKHEKYVLSVVQLGLVYDREQKLDICVDNDTIWEEQHKGLWGKYILTESGMAVAERFLNEGERIAFKLIRNGIVVKKGDYGIKEVTLSVLLEKKYLEFDETSERYRITGLGEEYLEEVENETE